jgi:hypothetical protein
MIGKRDMSKFKFLRAALCASLALSAGTSSGAQGNLTSALRAAYGRCQSAGKHYWINNKQLRPAVPLIGVASFLGGLYSYCSRSTTQAAPIRRYGLPVMSLLGMAVPFYCFARSTYDLATDETIKNYSWRQRYCGASCITARHFFMGGRGLDQASQCDEAVNNSERDVKREKDLKDRMVYMKGNWGEWERTSLPYFQDKFGALWFELSTLSSRTKKYKDKLAEIEQVARDMRATKKDIEMCRFLLDFLPKRLKQMEELQQALSTFGALLEGEERSKMIFHGNELRREAYNLKARWVGALFDRNISNVLSYFETDCKPVIEACERLCYFYSEKINRESNFQHRIPRFC